MVKNNQIISSDTFSGISDIVYSRYVSKDFIEGEGFDNYEILSERGNYYLVKIKNYTLIENSIVYTNTESLSFLFEDLKQADSRAYVVSLNDKQSELCHGVERKSLGDTGFSLCRLDKFSKILTVK